MKIGIMTFTHSNDNYGQLLQCWALQNVLNRFGHNAFVIKYTKKEDVINKRRLIKLLLFYPIILKLYSFYKKWNNSTLNKKLCDNNKLRNFDLFRDKRLNYYSQTYHSLGELKKNPPEADCYVAGSDTIWAQLINIYNNRAYFLDFGKDITKRVSYSASFQMSKYPTNLKEQLKVLLSQFNAISVREPEGVRICKELGFEAHLVCDPSLLLNRYDYISKFNITENNNNEIYIYSVNIQEKEEIRWDELLEYSFQKDIPLKINVSSGIYPGFEIYGNDVEYDYCTIEKWVENINNAAVVVSTSFHGIVFSIMMETPFIFVPFSGKKKKLNARILNLLEQLNLTNRILYKESSYKGIIDMPIDWVEVKGKIGEIREKSLDFLKQAI